MKRVSRRIIVVDYLIPKSRLHRWLHVSFASPYESKYYRDFAKRDLEELLREHDFRAVKEAYGLVDFVEILLCERKSLGKGQENKLLTQFNADGHRRKAQCRAQPNKRKEKSV